MSDSHPSTEFDQPKPKTGGSECSQDQVDRGELELRCINLLSRLENLFSKAREMDQDDFIDDSSNIGREILRRLGEFHQDYLTGEARDEACEAISRAEGISETYDEILKTRPIGKSLLRTFWVVNECPEILSAHSQLGEALIRSCVTTMYHTVKLAGPDTELGKKIDQSSFVFVSEIKKLWK